jgi:hypothetical protein
MTDDELAKVYSALSSLNRAEAKLQNGETQVESEIDAARLILLNLSEDASKPSEPKSSGHGRASGVTPPFETDSEGNVILKPVTGWAMAPVAETAVLLQIQYSDAEFETNDKKIQFVLTPQKCLELAEVLTKQARRLLHATLPSGTRPN